MQTGSGQFAINKRQQLLRSLKKLLFNVAPVTLLAVVLVASFRMVQSDPSDGSASANSTPTVTTQAVVVEAKSPAVKPQSSAARLSPPAAGSHSQSESGQNAGSLKSGSEKTEQVWAEINDAISGLNDLVGAEMFLSVKRGQKGQMEIRLDDSIWKRVRYQTRVDLKTDISDLWHLYVTEYGYAGSSVVYFIDDNDGRVIDIFSRAH